MYRVVLDKEFGKELTLILAKDIANISDLRDSVLSGNLDCAIIKAALVPDRLIISIAAQKAVIAEKSGKLRTKSLNSEILFNISPSKNISQSLQTFGIGTNDQHCLFAIVEEVNEGRSDQILSSIRGTILDVTELKNIADADLLKKIYRITDVELQVSSLMNSVVTRVSTKELD